MKPDSRIKDFVLAAVPFFLWFSLFYSLGYFYYLGFESAIFVSASAISQMLSEAFIPFSFSWGMARVFERFAAAEVNRAGNFWFVSFRKRSLLVIILMFSLLLYDGLFNGSRGVGNVKFPIVFLALFYLQYFLYGPTAGGKSPIQHLRRLVRIFKKRRRFAWLFVKEDFAGFVQHSSIAIVFAIGSWLGYSRCEYLAKDVLVELSNPDGSKELVHPVLNAYNAAVFLDEDDDLMRVPNPRFKLVDTTQREPFESLQNLNEK